MRFRDATADDYAAVVAMDPDHEIYNGNDYMPALYFRFLEDPDRTIRVCLVDGKIVALAMQNIVDGGKTIVHMSGRTHASARGTGVWRHFREKGIIGTLQRFDQVQYHGGVTGQDWRNYPKKSRGELTPAHLISKQVLCTHYFNPEAVEYTANVYDNGQATILSQPDARQLLNDDTITWKLFPNRRIICDAGFVVYRLQTDNFNKIIHHSKCITATKGINKDYQSIAFGFGFSVHNGYYYCVHYYGSDASDVSNVIDHVRVHLPIAVKHCAKGPIALKVFVPNIMQSEEIHNRVSELRGHEKTGERHTLSIFERCRSNEMSKL